jgi:hypothetical protein
MKKLLFLVLFYALLLGCKKKLEPTPPAAATGNDLNAYFQSMQPLQNQSPVPTPQAVGSPVVTKSADGITTCTSTKYALGPEFSEGFLLDPQSDVVYAGAILDGNSIADGSYKIVSLPRTGGVISADLPNVLDPTMKVDEVVKSKIQLATANLLNQSLNGDQGAKINFDKYVIENEKSLSVNLGLTVGKEAVYKVTAGFDFSSTQKKTRILVRLQQIYYTITFDPKGRPADYFQPSVTPAQVSTTINGTIISPVYVSNVKYGRLAYYSFESDASKDSLVAQLDAKFKSTTVNVDLDAKFSKFCTDSKTTIKGTIIGGSSADAIKSISGIDDFMNYVQNGGTYSKNSPGLPIAYTLRRLSDNGIFSVVKSTEYTVNKCVTTTSGVEFAGMTMTSGQTNANLYGTVAASVGYDGETLPTNFTSVFFATGRSNTFGVSTDGSYSNGSTWQGKSKYDCIYDLDKFDKAFILFKVNFTNYRAEGPYGRDKDKLSFETEAYFSQTYKVYLKDILNKNVIDATISAEKDGSYNLLANLPGNQYTRSICTGSTWIGTCSGSDTFTIGPSACSIKVNMRISVSSPTDN